MVFCTFFVAVIEEDISAPQPFSVVPQCQHDGSAPALLPPLVNLLPFCHPAGLHTLQRREYASPREHCFTLTSGDASRVHGFCRQTLPPVENGELLRLPRVLCIVSPHLWPDFFYKCLEIIDKLMRLHPLVAVLDKGESSKSGGALPLMLPQDCPAAAILLQLQDAINPPLGSFLPLFIPLINERKQLDIAPMRISQTVHITNSINGTQSSAGGKSNTSGGQNYMLQVPPSLGFASTFAGIPVARLLWYVTPRQAISLLASLLLERRVIFKASDPQTVSLAVHAAVSMLHPFSWQHVYLPLLPDGMHGILAAPMPLIAGVLSSTFAKTEIESLEGAVVVDLERLGVSIPAVGSLHDDALLLPDTERLVAALENAREKMKGPGDALVTPLVATALRDWFVGKIFGQYRQHLSKDWGRGEGMPDDDGAIRGNGYVFDYTAFVAAQRRRSERHVLFLDSFRHSQMLEVFIGQRLTLAAQGYNSPDAFELAVEECANSGLKSKGSKVAGLLRKSSGRVPVVAVDRERAAAPTTIGTPAVQEQAASPLDTLSNPTLGAYGAEQRDREYADPKNIGGSKKGNSAEKFPSIVTRQSSICTPLAPELLPLIDLNLEDSVLSFGETVVCGSHHNHKNGSNDGRAVKEENGIVNVDHNGVAQPQLSHLSEALSSLHIDNSLPNSLALSNQRTAFTSWVPFNALTPASSIGSGIRAAVPCAPGPLQSGIQPALQGVRSPSSTSSIGPLQHGMVKSMQSKPPSSSKPLTPGSIKVKDDAFGPLLTAAVDDISNIARSSVQSNF